VADYRGVVSGKSPDLEVVTQLWVGGFDTERLREDESKPGVVLGRPKEADEWHVECVRGAQHRVHHRQPHALPLIPGIDCDRAECSDGASFDRCPTADDVANKVTVTIGHEGQLGDDIVGLDQGVEERDLGRYIVGGVDSSERLRMYLAHSVRVGGPASSNQHVEMLTGDFERRYLGFRVLAMVPRRSWGRAGARTILGEWMLPCVGSSAVCSRSVSVWLSGRRPSSSFQRASCSSPSA
jgi:hypothetical protein